MTAKRVHAMPRFVVAITGHFFLFAWFRDLAVWSSRTQEAWDFFRIGLVSSVILVLTITVMLRGKPPEKIAAIGLSIVPCLCLFGALCIYVSRFL